MTAPSSEESSAPPDALGELRDALRRFALEREWDPFHTPKSLACALSVEAAELLEPFQWLSEAQSATLPPETLRHVRQELADVLLYLIRLADKLDVDLADAARAKLESNALRYPVAKARGSSRKYTEL
jgi:NTP pyrophosphatase (non-canonical NTP hydrolase)